MRRVFTIVLGVSMICTFACGSSSKPVPTPTTVPSPTPVSDEEFKAAAISAANGIQLTQADLPAGWTGKPYVKNHDQLDLSPECAAFNEEDSPNAVAGTDSDDFTDATDRTVSSHVAIYHTAGAALQDSKDLTSMLARCGQDLARALRKSMLKDGFGEDASVTFEAISPSGLGNWTNGYKFLISATLPSGTAKFHFDSTEFWKLEGRILVAFTSTADTPIDTGTSDALKALLLKRAADADAALPH